MVIYHICSQQRLDEKIQYAKENGGKLLLTGHQPNMDATKGAFPTYIHCLPNMVGAIPFAVKSESVVLKITLSPAAKVFHYQGPQDKVDFSKVAPDCDLIHTVYDNESFFQWQEMLLVSNQHVVDWTYDKEILRKDFLDQQALLAEGLLGSESFFYRDFTSEEQTHVAQIIGNHVGLQPVDTELLKELNGHFDRAYQRIEQKYNVKWD